jgi:hypothetical protein
MKSRITALALAVLAFPASALADPAREARSGATPHTQLLGPASYSPLQSRLPTLGTDVAAPDQQASIGAAAPVVAVDDAGGLDWSDAGIGAAGVLGLLTVALAGAITVRRRQHRRASALAG